MSTVYVRSDVAVDGNYVTVLEYSSDVTRAVNRDEAVNYARAVLAAAAEAAYDAAVVTQLTKKLDMSLGDAGTAIKSLRDDRPSPDDTATKPLTLTPGVSAANQTPFLHVRIGGKLLGQWTVDDAQQHALHVLTVSAAVDLDAAYFRYLKSAGVKRDRARAVVEDVGNWHAD